MEADVWICQFWGVIFQKRIFLNSVIEWIEAQFGVITGFEAMWKQNSFFNIANLWSYSGWFKFGVKSKRQ